MSDETMEQWGRIKATFPSVHRHLLVLVNIAVASLAFVLGATQILLALTLFVPILLLVQRREETPQIFEADPLTGIRSEEDLHDYLQTLKAHQPTNSSFSCIALSIDDFSPLERLSGANECDQIILQTAQQLSAALRVHDQLFRLARDRFVIITPGLGPSTSRSPIALCERLQEATAKPVLLRDQQLRITMSAGFSVLDQIEDGTGATLLRAACSALCEAEQNAPRAIRAYSAKAKPPVQSEASKEILDALREGQINAWFQPQVSTDTGEVTGFEALARWDHPEKGVILPADFYPALEDAHKTAALGELVWNQALQALVKWDQAGTCVPRISVNFSTQELRDPSLVERLKWDVDRYEIDPDRLTVEIVETDVNGSNDAVITHNIQSLRTQGFRIDLDDFGSGAASLSNISRFDADRIKIDRAFVAGVATLPDRQRMVAAIIGLSESLQIEVLAEGVETVEERSLLSQLGCTHLQGFAIAEPMPFHQTIDWMKSHRKTLKSAQLLGKRAS